jgi:GNAT superfamily N-acetyltransferase
MIETIESNDLSFTGFWSVATQLDCGILFLNPKLPNDIFFDKLTNVTCISEKMLHTSVEQFKKSGSKPYIYVLDNPELEDFLKKKGFIVYDTQHVLKKRISSSSKRSNVTKINIDNTHVWTKIFCEAYDCLDWMGHVNSILKNSLSYIDYFVDESNSSCIALYEKNTILGLYCLGTIPSRQKLGFASSLIDFALHEVHSRNLHFLMLEVYEKDDLLKFYSKLGFEHIYKKIIYTI